jgi:hypothetical protein
VEEPGDPAANKKNGKNGHVDDELSGGDGATRG